MKLKLLQFIEDHPNDWKDKLKEKPYCIDIKEYDFINPNKDNVATKYYLLSYDQYESDFSDQIVRECRGLIIRADNYKPVRLSFTKFFNSAEQHASPIDWDSAKVQEKIDGSTISLWNCDDFWHISSSGTFNAFEAMSPIGKSYGEMWMEAFTNNYGSLTDLEHKLNKDYCYTFELVHPQAQIVVKYDKPYTYHIGTRDMNTLEELNVDIGVEKPKEYNFTSLDETVKFAETLKDDKEGFVVVDKNWNRIKIKGSVYVMLHHLKSQLSYGGILEVILKGEDAEVLSYAPSYKDEFDKVGALWNNYINNMRKEFEACVKPIMDIESQKEFAIKLTSMNLKCQSYAFWARKNKLYEDNIEQYIRHTMPLDKIKYEIGIRDNQIITEVR